MAAIDIDEIRARLQAPKFEPFPLLRNRHLMTMVPALIPRRFPRSGRGSVERHFEVEPGARVLTYCHWQPDAGGRSTIVIIHGLEGSAEAHYVLGLADKALAEGMNVVRMNMRNCGPSLHLSSSLYNSGMSGDVLAIIRELKDLDGLKDIFIAGCSMGGNLVLKAAAELAGKGPDLLAGVCALSPALDLPACVSELERGFNRLYQHRFLKGLKEKIRLKHKQFPELYDIENLEQIKSIRSFDDRYTAPSGGYGTAQNYYETASALPIADRIRVPTLIIQAKDDPFVPFSSFQSPELKNSNIILLAPEHGGHGGFFQRRPESQSGFNRFWAENRVIDFCAAVMSAKHASRLSDAP